MQRNANGKRKDRGLHAALVPSWLFFSVTTPQSPFGDSPPDKGAKHRFRFSVQRNANGKRKDRGLLAALIPSWLFFLLSFFFSPEKKKLHRNTYRSRSGFFVQKNRATVPGPVWLPMTPPMGLMSTFPFM